MIYGLVVLAIIIGTLMPLQAGLNAELTRVLKRTSDLHFQVFGSSSFALLTWALWLLHSFRESDLFWTKTHHGTRAILND